MDIAHIPPKRLLVAFDFSSLARDAWGLARELALPLGASVEALFVSEAPVYDVPMSPAPVAPALARPLTDEARAELLAELHEALGEDARAAIEQGAAPETILRAARRAQADLIVMGTHGRSGPGRLLFGSAAEHVSRRSSIPVLTVRGEWRPVRSILVPLNFTDYSFEAFHAAAALAEKLGARFDALFVAGEPYLESLLTDAFEEAVAELGPHFLDREPRLLRAAGPAAERIVEAADGYDLVALVAHRRSMIHDVVIGTTAERVLRHCRVPVLSVPASPRVEAGAARRERAAAL